MNMSFSDSYIYETSGCGGEAVYAWSDHEGRLFCETCHSISHHTCQNTYEFMPAEALQQASGDLGDFIKYI